MILYVNLSSGPVCGNTPDEEDELAIPSAEVMPVTYIFITDRVPPDQRKHGRRGKTKLA